MSCKFWKSRWTREQQDRLKEEGAKFFPFFLEMFFFFFPKVKKHDQEAHIEGVLVQRMVKRWLASTGCNFSPQANPLEVGTYPLDHNHLDAPPLAQRHLHGDQLEGREEHLGLTGHAGKGDVRQ